MSTTSRQLQLVSVVVPAHNAASTVERTLRSALAQTHREIEIVVVDDGSTDGTHEIVTAVALGERRVRCLRQDNSGVAAARNAAIAASAGAFIAPLDADDIWHPEKLARQLAVMEREGGEIALVYCLSRLIDTRDRVIDSWTHECPTGHVYPRLVLSNFIRSASIPLIRRDRLEAAGGYDTSLRERGAEGCEDFALYLRLAETGRFGCVPEFLVGYRAGRNNMSRNVDALFRSWDLTIDAAREARPDLPDWLWRWAAGNFHRWLGFNALGFGNSRAGMRFLARAAAEDPAGSFRPELVLKPLEVLLARATRPLRDRRRATRKQAREAFFALDPQDGTEDGSLKWERARAAASRLLETGDTGSLPTGTIRRAGGSESVDARKRGFKRGLRP